MLLMTTSTLYSVAVVFVQMNEASEVLSREQCSPETWDCARRACRRQSVSMMVGGGTGSRQSDPRNSYSKWQGSGESTLVVCNRKMIQHRG